MIVPGAHHFSITRSLADPEGVLPAWPSADRSGSNAHSTTTHAPRQPRR